MGIKSSFFDWVFNFFMKKDKRQLCIMGSDSFKHPCGDIDFAEEGEKAVLLFLNETSLLGADSPLPYNTLRDISPEFLNMLQHHIAMFRFNAILEKSSFLMHKLGNGKWQNRFAMYNEKFSSEFLRCFFAKIFPTAQISVHCFEPLRIENPAPIFLGHTNLNSKTLLGKNCTSLTSAIRVNIDNVPFEHKKKDYFLNIKFPFKIKLKFTAKTCESNSQKLSENFWLGNKNKETLTWEKWL